MVLVLLVLLSTCVTVFVSSAAVGNDGRGIVMCAGKKQHQYIARNLFLIRHVWQSSLPFVLAHCNEVDSSKEDFYRRLDPSFQLLNLCASPPIFGMNVPEAEKCLHSFYCKIGALLKSPFSETMLMDADVVFFKRPDLLFQVPDYLLTGTLFMRERFYFLRPKSRLQPDALLKYFQSEGLSVNKSAATEHLNNRGRSPSLFWQQYAQVDDPNARVHVGDYQDSSVVLVDKDRHPGMLKILERYLQTDFQMGYGDKELFWIAATVANEPFAFEPYIAGQYRDCTGVLLHFDPTVLPPALPEPFYVNGEFLVERHSEPVIDGFIREVSWIGEHLQNVITRPIFAVGNVTFVDYETWRHGGHVGCTCQHKHKDGSMKGVLECVTASPHVVSHLVLAQWLTYTSSLAADKPPSNAGTNCVQILFSQVGKLNSMLYKHLNSSNYCPFIGCPLLPMAVEDSFPWVTETVGMFCDPVSFTSLDDPQLKSAATFARMTEQVIKFNKPPIPVKASVMCIGCGDTSVYLMMQDGKLHHIPDVSTFISLGLDFADTIKLPPHNFVPFEIGEALPSVSANTGPKTPRSPGPRELH
jgi:hypothetical protein